MTSEPDFVTLEEQKSKEESIQEIEKGDDIGNNLVQPHSQAVGSDRVLPQEHQYPIPYSLMLKYGT